MLRTRLTSLVAAETAQMQDFIAVLQQEREVLGQADVEPLFALAERKTQIARQLQQFTAARAALIAQAGLQHNRQGIEALLGEAGKDAWQVFVTTAEEAQQLNQDNGLRIGERLKNNHQALTVLMSSSDQPTVYGADGMARTRPGSRHFGSF
ncbi:MAG: flagellar protein FlgN [Rhodocyclaceae bacterium]